MKEIGVEKEKNKTIIDKIWDLFASVKLAVIMFSLIGLTSIVGTVIEQRAEPEKNIKVLTKMFGIEHDAAHSVLGALDRLGFTNMYHSWWFLAFLLIFTANLIICSIDRLPRILKLVKEPVKPLPEDHFKGFGIKKEVVLKGGLEKAKGTVMDAAKKALGFQFSEVREGNGYQLYSQKGNFTRLGVYITHFSILVILAGAVIGAFFGFKGFLNIPEGRSYPVAFARGHQIKDSAEFERILNVIDASSGNLQNAARQLGMDEGTLKSKMRSYGIYPLGFQIRCDEFNVDFYERTDMPKAYRSWLTVVKDGKEAVKKVIEVNDPLSYEGITFYQSSYGLVPGGAGNAVFRFRVSAAGGRPEAMDLRFGNSFIIPGTNITGKIEDFSPALGIDDRTGRPFTYAEQLNNPAVYINFFEGGNRKFGGWILKRYPETWRMPDGSSVEFAGILGMQYTGLQVRKDPGVWVVYLGCLVMAAGLFIAFFMSHRKIWIKLVEEKSGTRVIIGASANKNRHAFERRIDRMIGLFGKDREGGK
ncbi:MAG: cytochrome c biogenesis protein ResB [Nitrospirae bacterium]|nr:cytochrome c biogenesis protein ResB [Nitrospirota bacterium]